MGEINELKSEIKIPDDIEEVLDVDPMSLM